MATDDSRASQAFIERAFAQVQAFVSAIIPLFERRGARVRGVRVPALIGCSTALKWHDGRLFLLTANHVLEAFERREFLARTPVGGLLINGRVAASEIERTQLATDRDDAAVIEVGHAGGNAFEWIRDHALSAAQLDGAPCQPDEFLALVGCPSNRVERSGIAVVPNCYMWVGFTEAHSFVQVRLPADRHVAFEWDSAIVHGFPIGDADRRVVSGHGPSFHGVSGSPMIVIGNRDGPTVMTGVFTEFRDRHLIGTSVRVHLDYIADLLLAER